MFWKSRLDSDIGIARTTVISGLKVTVSWHTETSSFSPMGARGQRWSESHCQAAWWWGLGASSLTRITSTRDSEPPKEGGKSELLFDYRKRMASDEFSGLLAEMTSPGRSGLQRGDSNSSWKPLSDSQRTTSSTDERHPIDKNRLYLVSLGSLMELFR